MAVDGQRCPWHSDAPEWVEKRRQWSSKGGARRSNRSRARREFADAALSAAELEGLVAVTLRAVLAEKKPPAVGSAVAALARAAVAIRTASDFEARLAELEAAAGLDRRFPA